MDPELQDVRVMDVDGAALEWVQALLFFQLTVSVILIVVVVALAVVVFWRGG